MNDLWILISCAYLTTMPFNQANKTIQGGKNAVQLANLDLVAARLKGASR